MATKKYLEYLKSVEWANIKLDLLANRGDKCERCGSKKGLQVHHKSYENVFNETPDDLVVLCFRCHQLEHIDLIKPKKTLAQKVAMKKSRAAKKSKRAKKRNLLKVVWGK